LYANSAYLNEKNADKAKGIRKAMDLNSETASKYSNWQERLFYSGIILFIVWHIFEMYLINKQ
jgi:hypothetical protein